jgi:hypothetical protein
MFNSYLQSNDIPGVGSYIELFAKDFEALFRVHSFSIIRDKLPLEMRKKIILAKAELNQGRYEDRGNHLANQFRGPGKHILQLILTLNLNLSFKLQNNNNYRRQ